jgi:hypothetical protein
MQFNWEMGGEVAPYLGEPPLWPWSTSMSNEHKWNDSQSLFNPKMTVVRNASACLSLSHSPKYHDILEVGGEGTLSWLPVACLRLTIATCCQNNSYFLKRSPRLFSVVHKINNQTSSWMLQII